MTGVLDGVAVLDLSTGIAGPVTGDAARRPRRGGHEDRAARRRPVARRSPARRCGTGASAAPSSTSTTTADRDRLLALASRADVLIESYAPGTTPRLGIDYDTLRARNPRLVYCSITGYGDDGKHAERPGYDALSPPAPATSGRAAACPAARWRGSRASRPRSPISSSPTTAGWRRAATRPAVRGRAVGEHGVALPRDARHQRRAPRARADRTRASGCRTSLFQGVLATTLSAVAARRARRHAENFQTWISDPRAPKGVFRCADGRWIHQWVPLPDFVLSAAEGDRVQRTGEDHAPAGGDAPASAWTPTTWCCCTTTSR